MSSKQWYLPNAEKDGRALSSARIGSSNGEESSGDAPHAIDTIKIIRKRPTYNANHGVNGNLDKLSGTSL